MTLESDLENRGRPHFPQAENNPTIPDFPIATPVRQRALLKFIKDFIAEVKLKANNPQSSDSGGGSPSSSKRFTRNEQPRYTSDPRFADEVEGPSDPTELLDVFHNDETYAPEDSFFPGPRDHEEIGLVGYEDPDEEDNDPTDNDPDDSRQPGGRDFDTDDYFVSEEEQAAQAQAAEQEAEQAADEDDGGDDGGGDGDGGD